MNDPLSAFQDYSESVCKHFLDRTKPKVVPPRADGPAVVIDRVEVTAFLGQPLAGYGITFSRYARGWMHPQYATLILMDDAKGGRYLVIGFDLHAATRWVAENIAAITGPSIGVGIDRLFVTATHSHAGGGNFYGVQFYDHMVTNAAGQGFDDTWPKKMVKAITDKAAAMAVALEGGAGRNPKLGFGEKCVWGPIWQRALTAHLANFGAVAGMDQAKLEKLVTDASFELNDERAPDNLSVRRKAVDARVRCLTWEADGQPIGVLAFVGVTPTMFHADAEIAGGDGLGYAARYAEEQISVATKRPVYVSANGSAHGDTFLGTLGDFSAFADAREKAKKNWETLAPFAEDVVEIGARIGASMATAIALGRDASAGKVTKTSVALQAVPDHIHFTEEVMAGAKVRFDTAPVNAAPIAPGKSAVDPADARVGTLGTVGDGMLAGDPLEPGAPGFIAPHDWPSKKDQEPPPAHVVRGVRNTFDAADPQSPKTTSPLAILTDRLDGPAQASFSPFCTLRAAHFPSKGAGNGLTLIGIPFEPTTRGTYEIEQAVLKAPIGKTDWAVLACLAGDYIGYLVTREEYMAQMYEGGSSWFGRNVHRWVTNKVLETLTSPTTVKYTRAHFTSKVKKIDPKVKKCIGIVKPGDVSNLWTIIPPKASTGPDGKQWVTLGGSWSAAMDDTPHARAGQEAWLRLHTRPTATTAATLARLPSGLPADDKCGWITLFREIVPGETFVRWRWQYHGPLPADWSGKQLTFQVVSGLPGVVPLKVTQSFVTVP